MSPKATKEKLKAVSNSDSKDWWQTLPAIFAGLATIITATAGLVAAINQAGVLRDSASETVASVNPTPVESETIAPVSPVPVESDVAAEESSVLNNIEAQESRLSASRKIQATIDDPDGYTNIRAGAGNEYSIIGRVEETETFHTIPQLNEWWPVETKSGNFGYMHSSRIQLSD